MNAKTGAVYEPETIAILQAAMDAAWDSLAPEQQARTSKDYIAERILSLAAGGELDPGRLRSKAVIGIVPEDRPAA